MDNSNSEQWIEEWPIEQGYYWFIGKPTPRKELGFYIISVISETVGGIIVPTYHVMDTTITIWDPEIAGGYGLFRKIVEPTVRPGIIAQIVKHFRRTSDD